MNNHRFGAGFGAPAQRSARPFVRRHRSFYRALWSLFSILALPVSGQYAIGWFTIEGGGGTSTGGVYAVSGTIGQPGAGTMSGGNYSMGCGFWSIVTLVQTPGAPALSILRTDGVVTISWPLPADGWVLEQTSALAGASTLWTRVEPPYPTEATHCRVTVAPTPGRAFYRLRRE